MEFFLQNLRKAKGPRQPHLGYHILFGACWNEENHCETT